MRRDDGFSPMRSALMTAVAYIALVAVLTLGLWALFSLGG